MMIAVFIGICLVVQPFEPPSAAGDYVPFCEIVQNPGRYDQKTVTTSGMIKAGSEFSEFLDPGCATGPARDVGTLPVPLGDAVQRTAGWKTLANILDRDSVAFVVVRGVFDAYKRYEGPLPPDPNLQDILKRGNSRFGHQNFARFRLRIETVAFVAPVGK